VRRHAPVLAATVLIIASGAVHAESDDPLQRLRAFETARRDATDFRTLPASDLATGPDPVAIRPLPGKPLLVGLLRGSSALVLLDEQLREVQRMPTLGAPSGMAVSPARDVFVSAETSPSIAHYTIRDGRLVRRPSIPLPGVRSVRAVAAGDEGVLYVVEDHDHRLLTVDLHGRVLAGDATPVCLGPRHVLRTEHHVVVDCILAHTVVVRSVDARGVPLSDGEVRITHDGPIWSVDAHETADGLMLGLGGVEDHPLDRREGSFGYIDSFAWIYRVAGAPAAATRLAAVNVSALGVVTPKIVALTPGDPVRLRVLGYGDAPLAELAWSDRHVGRKGLWPRPEIVTRTFVPGGVMEASLTHGRTVVADPLLDAWVVDEGGEAPRLVPVADPHPRPVEARVGEALFFTIAMAPWNRTRGPLSRFTCETCHFEGGVDGRVHNSGRDDVRVTTRPLFGLGNDRPYFSRALDPDLAGMVHNEFHVAGLRNRHDPWFSLGTAGVAWLATLGVGREPLSPEALRRSLMTFLMGFTHRPNPAVVGRHTWSGQERRGAEVFRDRCAGCHAPRLVTDRPESAVPFAGWERLVMSPAGAIVWARDTREQTGIVPYVHPEGTRIPSLRRLYRKRPYFTNGSSPDLESVLARARVTPAGFMHDGSATPGGEPLDPSERAALRAFLDLL
jgi:hypothetical protein